MGWCCKKSNKVHKTPQRVFEVCEYSPAVEDNRVKRTAHDIRLDQDELQRYPKNVSETTKYNVATFLPKALMFQFKKYTNIYFGLLLIPACFEVVAAYGLKSELPPFLFILIVALARELVEDLRRHRSDREFNKSPCKIVRNNVVINSIWRNLVVGDIVLLSNNERIPADMVVVGTSNQDGRCYMETSTLDGEKNLKPREAVKKEPFCLTKVNMEDDIIETDIDLHVRVHVQHPTYILYDFSGFLEYIDPQGQVPANPPKLENKNLLLKGAKLKNTKWVLGIIVYTGNDTKIQMNATTAKSKMTVMEKKLHQIVIVIFIAQVLISIFAAFGRNIILGIVRFEFNFSQFLKFVGNNASTVEASQTAIENILEGFRYFLLLNTLIPISLIVNLEVVRFFQCIHLKLSYELYNPEKNIQCKVNTSSVNEELGQIEYILTDKTGTLTQNKMMLQGLCIGEQIFGGEFVRTETSLEFESAIEKSKKSRHRLLAGLEDKFDVNLHNMILSKDTARLKRPLTLANQKTNSVDLEALYRESCASLGSNVVQIAKKKLHLDNSASMNASNNAGNMSVSSFGQPSENIQIEKNNLQLDPAKPQLEACLNPKNEQHQSEQLPLRNIELPELHRDSESIDASSSHLDNISDPNEAQTPYAPGLNNLGGSSFSPNQKEIKAMNTDNFLKVQQPQIMMKKKANPEESIASSLPKLDFSKKKAPKHTAMNMSEDQDLPDVKSVSSEAKLKTFAGEEGSTTDPQRQQKSKYSNYPEAPSPKSNVSPPAPNKVTSYQELLMEFFTAATVCHECIVETDSEGHHNFQGPSPDEIAICKGARDIGCTFLGSNSQGQIELEYFGQKKSLELIMDFPFDSDRKRQSVLVKENGQYKLYVKGADNAMLDILAPDLEHPYKEKAEETLDDFSSVGLRTLVFGCRVLSKTQFEQAQRIYQDAVKSANKKEKMKIVNDILERDIAILGCTAIRDHLQEKVHESISRFVQANIKVWMITGDKLLTAESIGYSAGILQATMRVFVFDQCEKEKFPKLVLDLKRRMQRVREGVKKGIVVDISKINYIFHDHSKHNDKVLTDSILIFNNLLMEADSVVCARSSPKQKAKLVKLVKSKGKVVLAVGDGANDVNMLTVRVCDRRKPMSVSESSVRKVFRQFRYLITLSGASDTFGNLFLFREDGIIYA